jgi:MarR family transcriptional regulator, organic hydroperoxide resistance regulator
MTEQKPPVSLDFLLSQICHLHYIYIIRLLEDLKMYRSQPLVLNALWEREGLTQGDLAKRLKVTPATSTKMLQRMERAGFIRRVPDETDQRVMRVYLTENGHAIQNQVMKVWDKLDEDTFAGLLPEDRETLRRIFLHVQQNLLQVTGEEAWE